MLASSEATDVDGAVKEKQEPKLRRAQTQARIKCPRKLVRSGFPYPFVTPSTCLGRYLIFANSDLSFSRLCIVDLLNENVAYVLFLFV